MTECKKAPAVLVPGIRIRTQNVWTAALQQAALDTQQQLEAELGAERRSAAQLQEELQRAQEAVKQQQQLASEGAAHTGWGAAYLRQSHPFAAMDSEGVS